MVAVVVSLVDVVSSLNCGVASGSGFGGSGVERDLKGTVGSVGTGDVDNEAFETDSVSVCETGAVDVGVLMTHTSWEASKFDKLGKGRWSTARMVYLTLDSGHRLLDGGSGVDWGRKVSCNEEEDDEAELGEEERYGQVEEMEDVEEREAEEEDRDLREKREPCSIDRRLESRDVESCGTSGMSNSCT